MEKSLGSSSNGKQKLKLNYLKHLLMHTKHKTKVIDRNNFREFVVIKIVRVKHFGA